MPNRIERYYCFMLIAAVFFPLAVVCLMEGVFQ